jgi:hypothetical protein
MHCISLGLGGRIIYHSKFWLIFLVYGKKLTTRTILPPRPSEIQCILNSFYYTSFDNNYINIFSLTSSGLSMMKELDKTMSSDNMWRTIKVYLDVWNEYTILVEKKMSLVKFG